MTDDAEPGRPPAHDLAAFDLTKRSPQQLAESFAQWKARRRPPQATTGAGSPVGPKAAPVITKQAEKPAAPDDRALAAKRGWAKRSIPVQYSDTFSSLLAAGSEPAMQRIPPAPIVVAPPSQRRMVSPGRRLRAMTILAGAASLFALAAGALLELSSWRADDAEPKSAQIQQAPVAMIAPIARAAADASTVASTLRPLIDRALLKAAAPIPPTMQRTTKAVTESATSAAPQPKKAAPAAVQFVAKPFIPNVAPAAQPASAVPARAAAQLAPMTTTIHTGDPRPDALFQQNRGQGAFSGRLASSGSKPEAEPKSKSAVQAPVATRNGKAADAGSGDPRGENSGGAQAASDAGTGTDAGAADGADASAGEDGSASSGGNDAGGGDSGGADAGGEGTDAGGANAGEPGGSDAEPAKDPAGGETNADNVEADQGN